MSEQLLLPYFQKGSIYLIENIQNRKKYVGQTTNKNPQKYIKSHFKNAIKNRKRDKNKIFYKAIRKYGVHNFKWRILGEIYENSIEKLKEKLDEAETECIEFYQAFGSNGVYQDELYGYNMTRYGNSPMKGRNHTQEAKNKVSKFQKGKITSEQTKQKMSKAQKNRIFSEEHKFKMRHPKSEKGKRNIREALKRKNYKGKENPRYRHDLDDKIDKMKKLREQGLYYYEIVKIFDCSLSSIKKRLKINENK